MEDKSNLDQIVAPTDSNNTDQLPQPSPSPIRFNLLPDHTVLTAGELIGQLFKNTFILLAGGLALGAAASWAEYGARAEVPQAVMFTGMLYAGYAVPVYLVLMVLILAIKSQTARGVIRNIWLGLSIIAAMLAIFFVRSLSDPNLE